MHVRTGRPGSEGGVERTGAQPNEDVIKPKAQYCVASRALHRVPIPMPMPMPMGFGWAWVRYYCSWVGMVDIVPRWVWMGIASKWVRNPCPSILLETWT